MLQKMTPLSLAVKSLQPRRTARCLPSGLQTELGEEKASPLMRIQVSQLCPPLGQAQGPGCRQTHTEAASTQCVPSTMWWCRLTIIIWVGVFSPFASRKLSPGKAQSPDQGPMWGNGRTMGDVNLFHTNAETIFSAHRMLCPGEHICGGNGLRPASGVS